MAIIGLKWNRFLNGWELIDERYFEMYIFRNCANINRLYKDLDKTRINWYEVNVNLIKQEELPEDCKMGKVDAGHIATAVISFEVTGTSEYEAKLSFGNTKSEVIEVVKKIYDKYTSIISGLATTGECKVNFSQTISGEKPTHLKLTASVEEVFKMEYALVQAQKEMLDEVLKLG